MIETIKKNYEQCQFEENILYLLYPLSEEVGFFGLNKQILFVTKDYSFNKEECIETEELVLNLGTYIRAVSNNPSFIAGKYNYILFKDNINNSNFENFIKICLIYSKEIKNVSIKKFFYSIIDLFQLPSEQSYKNLLGIYGELSVILYIYKKYNIDLSRGWHLHSNDKFDFVLDDMILEIKTTSSNRLNVKLKYDQLYIKRKIYLGIVHVKEMNSGKTLEMLIEEINTIDIFKYNLSFQINLCKELNRISKDDLRKRKLECLDISFYLNSDIPIFDNIPESISDITYYQEFSDINKINFDDIIMTKKKVKTI